MLPTWATGEGGNLTNGQGNSVQMAVDSVNWMEGENMDSCFPCLTCGLGLVDIKPLSQPVDLTYGCLQMNLILF